jgi:uncharacterized protein (DUF4213/DUF364 family)
LSSPPDLYRLLQQYADSQPIAEVVIGLTWTLCRVGERCGLAMSPNQPTRTLPWSGQLVGRPQHELAAWLNSWQPYETSIAMAALNANINRPDNLLLQRAQPLPAAPGQANLAVFDHFLPQLQGQKVVIVGRYPGLERYSEHCDLTVLERQPGPQDLPDTACEYVLPEADWVFLTATSIPNRTFPRLAALSRHATTVLMGPTVPWLAELAEFGVDYLAGVQVTEAMALRQTVAEGGGVRIFETGVQYRLMAF